MFYKPYHYKNYKHSQYLTLHRYNYYPHHIFPELQQNNDSRLKLAGQRNIIETADNAFIH